MKKFNYFMFISLTIFIFFHLMPSSDARKCWFDESKVEIVKPEFVHNFTEEPPKMFEQICANPDDECVYIKCYANVSDAKKIVFHKLIDCHPHVNCSDLEAICGSEKIPIEYRGLDPKFDEPIAECKSCSEDLCNHSNDDEKKNGSVGKFVGNLAMFVIQAAIGLAIWALLE